MTSSFEDRTESKLRFAELHLKEIIDSDSRGSGDDFEISHEESCLFHIIGAKDSFLQEINDFHNLGIDIGDVKEKTIKKYLKKKSLKCKAFDKLKTLRDNPKSWYYIVINYRNVGTHRYRIPRVFKQVINGPRTVSYKNPPVAKSSPLNQDIPDYLEKSIKKMRKLLQKLRPLI